MFAASSAKVVFNLQLCMWWRGLLLLNHLFHELLAWKKKVSKRLLEPGCVNAATHYKIPMELKQVDAHILSLWTHPNKPALTDKCASPSKVKKATHLFKDAPERALINTHELKVTIWIYIFKLKYRFSCVYKNPSRIAINRNPHSWH